MHVVIFTPSWKSLEKSRKTMRIIWRRVLVYFYGVFSLIKLAEEKKKENLTFYPVNCKYLYQYKERNVQQSFDFLNLGNINCAKL